MPEAGITTYRFRFADGSTREFSLRLRHPSLELVSTPGGDEPEWTRLTFHQCPNCPLNADDHPRCPIATNLVPVNEAFRNRVSHEQVEVVVHTEARTYQKTCPLQEAVSSLMGLIMATSGCPHLDRLRPMVFTHLPFATPEETTYRAVSMYLLAQFFRQRHGKAPDWPLKDLSCNYDDIRTVNMAFAQRLTSIQNRDANLNAIIRLDGHARLTSSSITDQWWEDIEQIFRPYFANGPNGAPPQARQTPAAPATE